MLAIIDYARAFNLDPDRLKNIVWAVDKMQLEHWQSLDEQQAEQTKREAEEKKQQAKLGGHQ